MSQPVDHLGSPPFRLLPGENVSADTPIEQHEFPIDRQSGAHLRAADPLLQFLQERVIPIRQFRMFSFHSKQTSIAEASLQQTPSLVNSSASIRQPLELQSANIRRQCSCVHFRQGVF